MTSTPTPFDQFSKNYEQVHTDALPPMVESRQFLEQKVEWVKSVLSERFPTPMSVALLDFGCSVGRVLLGLKDERSIATMAGVDESQDSIRIAEAQFKGFEKPALFATTVGALTGKAPFDVVMAFNVFHHVEPTKRDEQIRFLTDRLKPGGLFLVWEHNPWNPATRYLVKICPFDEGVVLLRKSEAENRLKQAGLQQVESDYVNVSPPSLQKLAPVRWLEAATRSIPLGAQYRMVFRKPTA